MTHSFPTRRSSDLAVGRHRPWQEPETARADAKLRSAVPHGRGRHGDRHAVQRGGQKLYPQFAYPDDRRGRRARSEEHTSELQSLMRISYAVFCLKKKRITTQTNTQHSINEK